MTWYRLRYCHQEQSWMAAHYILDERTRMLFIKLPAGVITLGRIDKLPFIYIRELGCTMLINATAYGILVLPVE